MKASVSQVLALVQMNLRGLSQRVGSAMIIVVSLGGLTGVVVCLQGLAASLSHSVASSGRPDRALVLRRGADTERVSNITRDGVLTVVNAPGIAKAANGSPLVSAEVLENAASRAKPTGAKVNLLLRGVGPLGLEIRPELRIVQGRVFRPGTHELIVGRSVADRFSGLGLGGHARIGASDWTVVGSFETGGDAHESEIIGDAESVLAAFRHSAFNTVVVKLASSADFDGFAQAVSASPSLTADAERESDFFARQSRHLGAFLYFLAYGVGGIMAVGASIAALNAMFSAVASRTRAIATLRALGFGEGVVLASVFVEALALALAGGTVGAGAAWVFFDGHAVSTLNRGYTPLVFRVEIGIPLLAGSIGFAVLVGAIGGAVPAFRAARLPVATALRPE
jgi:putative ABC transport system permease protein